MPPDPRSMPGYYGGQHGGQYVQPERYAQQQVGQHPAQFPPTRPAHDSWTTLPPEEPPRSEAMRVVHPNSSQTPQTFNYAGHHLANQQVLYPNGSFHQSPVNGPQGRMLQHQTNPFQHPYQQPHQHSPPGPIYHPPYHQPMARQPTQPSPRQDSRALHYISQQAPYTAPVRAQHDHSRPQPHQAPVPSPQVPRVPQNRAPSSTEPQYGQRGVAHVEIPVQRSVAHPQSSEMIRPQKRRRSNEGHVVDIYEARVPQKRSATQAERRTSTGQPQVVIQASPKPPRDLDYQAVLLSLADEYVGTAYAMSNGLVGGEAPEKERQKYYSYLSTGMGCLESVLNNYRQSDPRKEARIRLRLAALLVEETENDEEAEAVLSKGISLCERSRLPDLKYSMHHFAIRLMYKTSPKAALRAVDKLVIEVEALSLQHWEYAFRILRVTLSMQMKSGSETAAVLKHLSALNSRAEAERHVAVQIVASLLEAMVHVRSCHADGVELAQSAMAKVRQHQLGPEMKSLPQAQCMLACLDLMAGLIHFDEAQTAAKLHHMHIALDHVTRDPNWSSDGCVPLEMGPSANEELALDTAGIMRRSKLGNAALSLQWLAVVELYAIGFLLSGHATMQKNSMEGKADKAFREGLKMERLRTPVLPRSLATSSALHQRRRDLANAVRLELVFSYCSRHEYATALESIKALREDFAVTDCLPNERTIRTLLYLEAVCKQGEGELEQAMELYSGPQLNYELSKKADTAEKDLHALVVLHRVMISRHQSDEKYNEAVDLLSIIDFHCSNHADRAMISAFNLVKATFTDPQGTIVKTKQFMQTAVSAAKASANQQLLVICMSLMTDNFFKGIVGEQAEKSAGAARSLAKRTRDGLWTAVADGMYADVKELCGKSMEAEVAMIEGRAAMMSLPERLRNGLMKGLS